MKISPLIKILISSCFSRKILTLTSTPFTRFMTLHKTFLLTRGLAMLTILLIVNLIELFMMTILTPLCEKNHLFLLKNRKITPIAANLSSLEVTETITFSKFPKIHDSLIPHTVIVLFFYKIIKNHTSELIHYHNIGSNLISVSIKTFVT